MTLWLEAYARSLVEPHGPWRGFAARTVHDWLAVLDDPRGDATLLLPVLRGSLLDLLGTGDVERTSAAFRTFLDTVHPHVPDHEPRRE